MRLPREWMLAAILFMAAGGVGCEEKAEPEVKKPDAVTPSRPSSAPVSRGQQSLARTDALAEFLTHQDADEKRDPTKRVIELRLLDDRQVLVNRRESITLDQFKQQLSKATAQYRRQGVQPSDILVHLWAEENVSCGRFDKLVADCRENQIKHYVFKIQRTYLDPSRAVGRDEPPPINVRVSLSPREGGPPPENESPPITIRLKSKEDGSLARIWMNQLAMSSVDELRGRLVNLKNTANSTGGPGVPLKVVFDTDDGLFFKHLAEAVANVAVSSRQSGLVPLIENVVPTRVLDRGEDDELE